MFRRLLTFLVQGVCDGHFYTKEMTIQVDNCFSVDKVMWGKGWGGDINYLPIKIRLNLLKCRTYVYRSRLLIFNWLLELAEINLVSINGNHY